MISEALNISAPSRLELATEFLAANGIAQHSLKIVAGDASFRKYYRIFHADKSYILMDAPPDKEDVKPFLNIAEYLVTWGFSAPRVLFSDVINGFLLLEDLGDDLYSRYLSGLSPQVRPQKELEIYKQAIDVLLKLQECEPANALPYNLEAYMREITLFADWFLPRHYSGAELHKLSVEFRTKWFKILEQADLKSKVTVLRDYHADNLLWLPSRSDVASVGLLDFQDALIGEPEYDLVSLLEDARRDISAENTQELLQYYVDAAMQKSGASHDEIIERYHLLGAQRNLKIIGIFNRLDVRDGKSNYLKFLPRVWRHLNHDLQIKPLQQLAEWINLNVPMQ